MEEKRKQWNRVSTDGGRRGEGREKTKKKKEGKCTGKEKGRKEK